jgi:hypothetical protein
MIRNTFLLSLTPCNAYHVRVIQNMHVSPISMCHRYPADRVSRRFRFTGTGSQSSAMLPAFSYMTITFIIYTFIASNNCSMVRSIMNLTVRIPDELASRLGATGPALERQALEAFVVENFRAGRMTTEDLRKALGFEVLNEVDGFLEARGVYEPYTVEEINRQVETVAKLGY